MQPGIKDIQGSSATRLRSYLLWGQSTIIHVVIQDRLPWESYGKARHVR
jgi:hypothetical protein